MHAKPDPDPRVDLQAVIRLLSDAQATNDLDEMLDLIRQATARMNGEPVEPHDDGLHAAIDTILASYFDTALDCRRCDPGITRRTLTLDVTEAVRDWIAARDHTDLPEDLPESGGWLPDRLAWALAEARAETGAIRARHENLLRYVGALETVFCPDGVPQAVTRAMEELRPVPEVGRWPKIADLELVLTALGRCEREAVQWDGAVSAAAEHLWAAVRTARVRAEQGIPEPG